MREALAMRLELKESRVALLVVKELCIAFENSGVPLVDYVEKVELEVAGCLKSTSGIAAKVNICKPNTDSIGVTDKLISIYVDCQTAQKTLVASIRISSEIVKTCKKSLKELSSANSLRLCWIVGNVEIEGNDTVDTCQRYARKD
uniref:Uncharacterized protein n=1 Tax=Megaselia scalaris TaxID=36166 RepID=T1H432_MEGSC